MHVSIIQHFRDVWSETFFAVISSKKLSQFPHAHFSINPNITQKTVETYPEFNWDYYYLCENPNMTFDLLMTCKNKSVLNWYAISRHPNVTMEIVEAHPHKPWKVENLGKNPNVTMETILSNPQFAWFNLGKNKNITINDVKNNPLFMWDWNYLTQNPNMTMNVIENNLDCPWDWECIQLNPHVTFDFVAKHIDPLQLVDFAYYFKHPTLQNVLNNRDFGYGWRLDLLSSSKNVTLDEILENMECPDEIQRISWDLPAICSNPNVKMNDITKNQHILAPNGFTQMHVDSICRNPNLTLQYLADKEEEWHVAGIEINWDIVCYNHFEFDRNTFVENMIIRLLLMKIHYHCEYEISCYVDMKQVERIFIDAYIMQQIIQF